MNSSDELRLVDLFCERDSDTEDNGKSSIVSTDSSEVAICFGEGISDGSPDYFFALKERVFSIHYITDAQ